MEVGVSTVSEKGQVTIPISARKRLRVAAGDKVLFKIEDDKVLLTRIGDRRLSETLDSAETLAHRRPEVSKTAEG